MTYDKQTAIMQSLLIVVIPCIFAALPLIKFLNRETVIGNIHIIEEELLSLIVALIKIHKNASITRFKDIGLQF